MNNKAFNILFLTILYISYLLIIWLVHVHNKLQLEPLKSSITIVSKNNKIDFSLFFRR